MKQNPTSSPQVLSPQLQRRLDRHFLACSATVGASIALAVGASEAKADIVYSGPLNIQIPVQNFTGVYFDFDTKTATYLPDPAAHPDVTYDANIFDAYIINGSVAYHSVSFYGDRPTGNAALATISDTNGQTLKLAANFTVGPGSTTFGKQNDLANQYYDVASGTKVGAPTGQWLGDKVNVQIGYIGFKFLDKNNQTDYGWFKVSFDPVAFMNDEQSTTILGWAFNNSGGTILTGQIPEPSSVALALLGAGAAGLGFWRKKRAEAKKLDS
jgi:hypothetical protein